MAHLRIKNLLLTWVQVTIGKHKNCFATFAFFLISRFFMRRCWFFMLRCWFFMRRCWFFMRRCRFFIRRCWFFMRRCWFFMRRCWFFMRRCWFFMLCFNQGQADEVMTTRIYRCSVTKDERERPTFPLFCRLSTVRLMENVCWIPNICSNFVSNSCWKYSSFFVFKFCSEDSSILLTILFKKKFLHFYLSRLLKARLVFIHKSC